MMDNNKIFALNHIIYQIYNTEDFEKLKVDVLAALKNVIPCVCGSIFMGSDDEEDVCEPVCVPKEYIEMEQTYFTVKDMDYCRWLAQKKQSMVVNSSDLMPEEERVKTDFYQLSYKPFGVHYSVYLTIASQNKFLGIVTLYRTKEQGDFNNDDQFILQLLSEHLNARFYRQKSGIGYSLSERKNMSTYIAQYALTEREAEIVSMIFARKSNSEISEELVISNNTLKKHLQNIYRKTGVSGRTQLLALMQEGVIGRK